MNRLSRGLRSFGAFWWDFIVGDDWRIAVGVVVALAVTKIVASTDTPAWWLLPVVVVLLLVTSLHRGVRRKS
jgi:hypothetical protein